MKRIEELEKYLEDECYSFIEISIGKHYTHEGIVIEKNGNAYEFGYSERGNKKIIKSFASEQELVEYALEKLIADKWKKHIWLRGFGLKRKSNRQSRNWKIII